jgi:hypothetical protein
MIEFSPVDPEIIRDYLRLITLCQGHIIDPNLLERMYLENNQDLRKTITQIQFWCQFGIGDSRGGTEWINWSGIESDWMISRGTCQDGVQWRQQASSGEQAVLETIEETTSDLDIEEMLIPQELHDNLATSSKSIFKRQKSVLIALQGMTEFLDTMSFLDCTVDQQFTAYEVTPFLKPSSDDVLSDLVLRSHPGRRFEKPQGVEMRWSPSIRVMARKVLQESLESQGYLIPSLSSELIVNQRLKDILNPRPYHPIINF